MLAVLLCLLLTPQQAPPAQPPAAASADYTIGPQDILKIAFKGRLIDRLDHPAIRRLRGES